MVLIGAILSLFYWLLDSAVDSLILEKSLFLNRYYSLTPGSFG